VTRPFPAHGLCAPGHVVDREIPIPIGRDLGNLAAPRKSMGPNHATMIVFLG
jgi:hypothetical protein